MNIYTVRDILKNKIAEKERTLEGMVPDNPFSEEFLDEGEVAARRTKIEFLRTDIKDLKEYLAYVEVCCEQHSQMSWQLNPERMGQ